MNFIMRQIYQLAFLVAFAIFTLGYALVLMINKLDCKTCQFCDEKVYEGYFFGRDWCCSMCWYDYGLDYYDHVHHVPLSCRVAEVEIEEIEDDVI